MLYFFIHNISGKYVIFSTNIMDKEVYVIENVF